MNFIFNFLKFITNNENKPRLEIEFDFVFFIITTLALIFGIVFLIIKECQEWIAFLVIEYIWCIDNIRHNRP